MTSAFFSAGLGIGFIVGIATALICWLLATRTAEAKYKGRITQLQQSQALQMQNVQEKVKALIAANGNGTNLSEKHKQVMQEELSSVLRARK